jgi:hypothetical protein
MHFWSVWQYPTRNGAELLFDGRHKGYMRAAKDVANYAANKAAAMRCRLSGDVQTALMYEGICNRIYDKLPSYARW